MNYETFRQAFSKEHIIKLDDIVLRFPHIDRKQLTRWKSRWYILHVSRGIYTLPETVHDTLWRQELASTLVEPSYISLEYALSYYSLIPEEVSIITSITTKKTESYDLSGFGRYRYQSIIPRAFVGYTLLSNGRGYIAVREKAIVDFLYLHADYDSEEAFDEWRMNTREARESLDRWLLIEFAKIFGYKRLIAQVHTLISYIWW